MSGYLGQPFFWVAVVFGTGVIFVAVEVLLQARHLKKVDDLANALHEDLTKAETEIDDLKREVVELKARVVHGQRLARPVVKPLADTQTYGRHAHKG